MEEIYLSKIRELKAAMYPENRYLQNKVCVHLAGLSKNKNKQVAETAKELLSQAELLEEPYSFEKQLVRPQNISKLFDLYDETILLIESNFG
ncbi:hypothetical protein GCM10023210_09680 [Chryseobacterium ginsengisoli]|uniref:Uncharacterized protein n=1 Tax=Chryseobacterium ginsengisoli TaxID=363853 RepID=A0ABP9M0N2_9FLAO